MFKRECKMLKAMNTYQTIQSQIANSTLDDILGLVQLKQRCYNLAASQSALAKEDWQKLHEEVNQRLELAGAKVTGISVKLENSFYKLSRHPVPLNKITEYPISEYENHFRPLGASKEEIIHELDNNEVIVAEEIPVSWLNALSKERNRLDRELLF